MKPIDLMSKGIDTSGLPTECAHEARWWVLPWCEWYHWGPHPLLQGRQWMMHAENWQPWMLEKYEPSGLYISRSAAAYPDDMNVALADIWVRGCVALKLRQSQSASMVRTGRWSNSLVATHLVQPTVMPCTQVGAQPLQSAHTHRSDLLVFLSTLTQGCSTPHWWGNHQVSARLTFLMVLQTDIGLTIQCSTQGCHVSQCQCHCGHRHSTLR